MGSHTTLKWLPSCVLLGRFGQSSRDTPGERHELKLQGNVAVLFSVASSDRSDQTNYAGRLAMRIDQKAKSLRFARALR